MSITRRSFVRASVAAAAFAPFSRAALAQDARMRFLWWGSQARADRTNKAIEAYKAANAGTEIVGEFVGWSDYWPRLATQVAGRNAPDLIQMDYRYIFEYARRNALAPLDDLLGSTLKIEDFGARNIDSGRVDGKLYGINLGVNSSTVIYNAAAWEKAGVEPPSGQTWESFQANCVAFGKNKPRPGVFGSADAGGVEPAFEAFLRQRGKALYLDGSELGYTAEDAADWYGMWQSMRDAGACVPADIQALDQLDIETNPITSGKSVASFVHSNQFVGYQAVNKAKLALAQLPTTSGDAPSGHYLKPSMFVSIAAQSANRDAAARFSNFLVAEPAGASILGLERGVPASAAIRAALAPSLNEDDTTMADYITLVTPIAGPLPPPPPTGAGELQFTLKRINEQVGFGRTSPADAGKELVNEAQAVLARG